MPGWKRPCVLIMLTVPTVSYPWVVCEPSLRPATPLQGGEWSTPGAMNNTAFCPQRKKMKLLSSPGPAHLLTLRHLPPDLSVTSTACCTGSISQRVHFLPIASHPVFLSLEAGNVREAEWISSGMTTAHWHLSLFCSLLLLSPYIPSLLCPRDRKTIKRGRSH